MHLLPILTLKDRLCFADTEQERKEVGDMEFGSGRSGHDEGEGAKVERRSQSSGGGGGEDHREQETVVAQVKYD